MHGTHLEDLVTKIKPRAASSMLLWIIVAFVVIFFVWAAFTELDRTVRGQGRVVPSSQLQVVSNLEGGVVQDILVRSGQIVRQGDELIRLDRTATGAELGSGSATLAALEIKIARLTAEVTGGSPRYPAATRSRDRRPDPGRAEPVRDPHGRSLRDHRQRRHGADRPGRAGGRRGPVHLSVAPVGLPAAADGGHDDPAAGRARHRAAADPHPGRSAGQYRAERHAGRQRDDRSRPAGTGRGAVRAHAGAAAMAHPVRHRARHRPGRIRRPPRALPALADRAQRTVLRAPLAGRINRVLVSTRGGTIRPGEPVVEIVPVQRDAW